MKRLFAAAAALFLGAALAMAQDYNAAVDTFNQAIQSESKAERLELVRSALTQFLACEEPEAADMVEQCKVIIPETLISLGKENINNKEYDEAIKFLREAVAVASEYEMEDKAIEANKLIPEALMRKGSLLVKNNSFAEAIDVLKEVVILDAENGKAWLLLGQSYVKNNQFEESVDVLLKAAELGQVDNANKLLNNVYIKIGDNLLKDKKTADAIAYYEKALEIKDNAQLVLKIANTYSKAGSNANAISWFKRYLEAAPEAANAADVKYTIAATAQKAGDKATAIEYYNMLKGDAKYGATATQMLGQLK